MGRGRLRARVAAVAWTCLFGAGCTTSTELGGVWRSEVEVPGPLIGGGDPVYAELSLGHYGPDVAGLLRFYHDLEFEQPFDSAAPYRACACIFVHKGRWLDATSRLDFQLRGCMPGISPQEPLLVRGELELDADELEGTLRVEEPTSPHFGTEQPLRLVRTGSLGDADLRCEQPESAQEGNRASGR